MYDDNTITLLGRRERIILLLIMDKAGFYGDRAINIWKLVSTEYKRIT